MMLLDGHFVAEKIYREIGEQLQGSYSRKPSLATIVTTDNPASHSYINRKVAACNKHGFISHQFHLNPKTSDELIAFIDRLNSDSTIDAILVQLPLAEHLQEQKVLESIDPEKDVDGFHPLNVGRILIDDFQAFCPCTPLGIHALLDAYNIPIEGQHVVIIGRSHIVGRPLASLLLQNSPSCNATVTVCHSHTKDLSSITKSADILVAALGRPLFVKNDMIKEGAAIIDVGINKIEDSSHKRGYKIVGDVDFENVKEKCSAISPVPGGVGPMTIAMLLKNTAKSFLRRMKTDE